jgi:rRNA-processing protein FCF1
VKDHGGIIATLDNELKMRIKKNGGSILSVSSDKIVLEPSKL